MTQILYAVIISSDRSIRQPSTTSHRSATERNDEGKINGSRPNRAIRGEDGKVADIICGKFFICDCRTDHFDSLPEDMMKKYKEQFLMPESFYRINGEVHAIRFDPDKEKAR